jgi:hypothetical protein
MRRGDEAVGAGERWRSNIKGRDGKKNGVGVKETADGKMVNSIFFVKCISVKPHSVLTPHSVLELLFYLITCLI